MLTSVDTKFDSSSFYSLEDIGVYIKEQTDRHMERRADRHTDIQGYIDSTICLWALRCLFLPEKQNKPFI